MADLKEERADDAFWCKNVGNVAKYVHTLAALDLFVMSRKVYVTQCNVKECLRGPYTEREPEVCNE